jgi:membrane protein
LNEGGSPLSTLKRLSRPAWLFLRFVYRRFLDDRCLMTATALSYTTLLSIVPLLVVLFSTLSAFPAFNHVVERMQGYIFRNFVPAAGEILQTYFRQFLERAGTLTGVGGAFLIVGALTLMNTIDGAVNAIWRVRRRRRLVLKMAVYWAALTLGPVLLAVSIAGTSYVMAMPEASDLVRPVVRHLLSVLPFLFTALALTMLYVFVPNCSVPLRNGVAGAVIAAAAFEIAKAAFAAYVAKGTAYATIYGALAAIPLFLTWIYLSWAIVLAGAELSFCLTSFKADRYAGNGGFVPLFAAYRIIGHLWRAQLEGAAVSSAALLGREKWLTVQDLGRLMGELQARHVVYGVDAERWALARDLDAFTLLELYRIFPVALDREPDAAAEGSADDWGRALAARVAEARARWDEGLKALEVPLKALYQPAAPR